MKLMGVVGIGSPFGADNIASHVIKLVKQNLAHNDCENQIHIEYYDRPGIYLLEFIKNLEMIHLVDAIISDKPSGTIHRYENLASFQKNNRLLSSHGLGVAEVLALGETLDYIPDKIIIHGIEITNHEPFDIIYDDMGNACNTLAVRITKELTDYFKILK